VFPTIEYLKKKLALKRPEKQEIDFCSKLRPFLLFYFVNVSRYSYFSDFFFIILHLKFGKMLKDWLAVLLKKSPDSQKAKQARSRQKMAQLAEPIVKSNNLFI
jgi:hypothetical protein